MGKISVIVTHWGQNEFRSETMRCSIESLIETTKHLPVEIIIVDNGQNLEDSLYLLGLAHEKRIQFYVRNSENLYFGHARNQGIGMSVGDYICVVDNDIEYLPGWLDNCLGFLRANPDKKLLVTPLKTDRQHRQEKLWAGEVEYDGKKYLVNMRAGSNCWVMRREDFLVIGKFRNHHVAGSLWNDAFVRAGYLMATFEEAPLTPGRTFLARDMGFKKGYNIKQKVELARVFANGERLIINN